MIPEEKRMTHTVSTSMKPLDAVGALLLYLVFAGLVSWFSGEVALIELNNQAAALEHVAAPENMNSLPVASWPLFMENVEASDFLFSTFQAESYPEPHHLKPKSYFAGRVHRVIEGSLRKNETFYRAMIRNGVSTKLRSKIVRGLSGVVDFRKLHAGDTFVIKLDEQGRLLEADYEKTPFEVYAFVPERDVALGKKAFRKPVFVERRVNKLAGYVDRTLEGSLRSAGAGSSLIRSFRDIFSSRIDTQKEVQPGDYFEVVFEEYFKKDVLVASGRILVADYVSKAYGRSFEAFYYAKQKGMPGRYFDAEGNSMELDLLRAPLESYRLTSRFTSRRFHPVLKRYFPHYGVDLAAPVGTPVMATADGRVSFAGWQRGFGRTVVLEHKKGIKTYYGHLSRFGKNIRRGIRVQQKQIIGYVGKSGVVTGPHLDYRVSVNGRFKDPFKIKSKATGHLEKKDYAKFLSEIQALDMMLRDKFSGRLLTETIKLDGTHLLPNG